MRVRLNKEVAGGHEDILATILARKSARMSVSVSLSAPWNASLTKRLAGWEECHQNNPIFVEQDIKPSLDQSDLFLMAV